MANVVTKETEQALKKLRLERTKERALTLKIEPRLKEKLLSTNNQELLQAALLDQSRSSRQSLTASLRARATLNEIAELSAKPDVRDSLLVLGINPEQIRISASLSPDPVKDVEALTKILGTTNDGRLRLGLGAVLITKPEPIFDDNLPPGNKGKNPPVGEAVWRSGLKFAALLGVSQGLKAVGLCSGTILSDKWVVTAAHCLLDGKNGGLIEKTKVSVFLPFQNGSESISSPNGFINKGMRRVKVDAITWIGETTNDGYPTTEQGFSQLILEGKDLALLTLNQADVSLLPFPIASVKLYAGKPKNPPVSAVGYGITDLAGVGDLALLVGVRNTLPSGIEDNSDLLTYGPNELSKSGGTCGGDSGGGLFTGRVDGQASQLLLIGVVSSLVGSSPATNSAVCLVSRQSHTSLLTPRNREFICSRVLAACS
jgi:Trypsin